MKNKKIIIIFIAIIAVIIGIVIISKHNNNRTQNVASLNTNEEEKNELSNQFIKYDNEVPILCYHGVLDKAWGDTSIFVKVAEFDAQMKYLKEQGYTTLFISEIADANKYEKPIIITFDDGYRDVYTNAFPILQKYNIKANLYIISSYLNGDAYMTTDMLKKMAKSPLIEIGSHTVTHKVLTKATDTELEYQLSESKKTLEEITGKDVISMAYPTGAYDNRVIEIVKKYYKYGVSIVDGKENPDNLNIYELRRVYMYRDYDIEKFKQLL